MQVSDLATLGCLTTWTSLQDAASSRFQLPDEDGGNGEGEGLTHMGRSLSEFDNFPGQYPRSQ